MKVYLQRDGRMMTADVTDDAVCMELGWSGYHRELPPIVAIDFEQKVYRRRLGGDEPFPTRWYRTDDLSWASA